MVLEIFSMLIIKELNSGGLIMGYGLVRLLPRGYNRDFKSSVFEEGKRSSHISSTKCVDKACIK